MGGAALQWLGLPFVLAGESNRIATAPADGYGTDSDASMLLGIALGAVGTVLAFDVEAWFWKGANEDPLEK